MPGKADIEVAKPPATLVDFQHAIEKRYDELSDRLRRVARHLLDEPNDLAFETLAVIARRSNVQPSTIVRFAQSFGFEGASQMQRLVRDDLLRDTTSLAYTERARQFRHSVSGDISGPGQLLSEFVEGNALALQNLSQVTSARDLEEVIGLIGKARTVFVVGFRRSFPVAAYLTYLLAQADQRVALVDAVGGMQTQQTAGISSDDLLIAISFSPYSAETLEIASSAAKNGCPVIAISDSALSPVAKLADLVLKTHEAEVRGFRSLAASMCLVQAIAIGFVVKRASPNLP